MHDVFAADDLAEKLRASLNQVKGRILAGKKPGIAERSASTGHLFCHDPVFVLLSITLGIASVLAIVAIQKSRQLGILKAMGTNDKSAARIFIIQGFFNGICRSTDRYFFRVGMTSLFMFGTKRSGGPTYELKITLTNILLPALRLSFQPR